MASNHHCGETSFAADHPPPGAKQDLHPPLSPACHPAAVSARSHLCEERIRLRSYPKVFVISEEEVFEGIQWEHAAVIGWNRRLDICRDLDRYTCRLCQSLARIYGMG